MQKLVLFKLINDKLEFVGHFDNPQIIVEYFVKIQEMIDNNMKTNLQGQYMAIPTLFYEIKKSENKSENLHKTETDK